MGQVEFKYKPHYLLFFLILFLTLLFPLNVYAASGSLVYSDNSDLNNVSISSNEAESLSLEFENTQYIYNIYFSDGHYSLGNISLGNGYDSSSLYAVDLTIDFTINSSIPIRPRNVCLSTNYNESSYMSSDVLVEWRIPSDGIGDHTTTVYSVSDTFYFYGDQLSSLPIYSDILFLSMNNYSNFSFDLLLNYSVDSIHIVSSSDTNDYQAGYNAGYAAGEESGYSNGYSSGYSAGESAGIQSGFDSGYQAGIDSVDTQSFYDSGYQAGYDAAYSVGYDEGYTSGYDAAMERISSWGADTSEYPLLISESNSGGYNDADYVTNSQPFDYYFNASYRFNSIDFDSNHVYKFIFNFDGLNIRYNSSLNNVYYGGINFYCDIGGVNYPLFRSDGVDSVLFIVGNKISSSFNIGAVFYGAHVVSGNEGEILFDYDSFNLKVYDMGPANNTQNHIANQTDELTSGYDQSAGDTMNEDFSSNLTDFQDQEHSLFTSVSSGLDDFEFFNIESVPAVLTGISFVSSVMNGWFNAAGGLDGIGIVLSMLFSVMIAAMALGLYRLYQSKGKGK